MLVESFLAADFLGCLVNNDNTIQQVAAFTVEAGNFTLAGDASSKIKRILKQLGLDAVLIRRIAVSSYEAELNLVIHSYGGEMFLEISPYLVRLRIKDIGPGIPDIEKAMTEGFSTASDEVRDMGFGAGMGLPNMKKNSDSFEIESIIKQGTTIIMEFYLK